MISVKNLASIFLFLVLVSSLFIAVWDLVSSIPIQPVVFGVLGVGVGHCITLLGLDHGINATDGTVAKAITLAMDSRSKE